MKNKMPVIDNLTEMLNLIIHFTNLRRKILTRNIQNADTPDYRPQDLPVRSFSKLVEEALNGHLLEGRLIWQDTDKIRYGGSGQMTVTPQFDEHAESLRRSSSDAYLKHQTRLLLENELNRKVADRLVSRRLFNASSVTH